MSYLYFIIVINKTNIKTLRIMTTNNFNYNEFKNGRIATTKLGKAVKFVCDLKDGNMLVAEERYRGKGFLIAESVPYRYKKDGTAVNYTPFNQLFFAE